MSGRLYLDWEQFALNAPNPCFAEVDGEYCGRAASWAGHYPVGHRYVSFDEMLAQAEEFAAENARQDVISEIKEWAWRYELDGGQPFRMSEHAMGVYAAGEISVLKELVKELERKEE